MVAETGPWHYARRQFLHLAAGVAALPAITRIARAQAYPARPVRIIVTFRAGGSNDTVARLMGQWLSDRLGQPFVIENRSGAGGNTGTEAVVRASADGHTLLLACAPNAISATLYDKLNFTHLSLQFREMQGNFAKMQGVDEAAERVNDFETAQCLF